MINFIDNIAAQRLD